MKTKLLQTTVPVTVDDEVRRRAVVAGISTAAWLRQLVLKETGFEGDGKKKGK